MAIEIASSFDMKSQLPIDGRYVVDDLTARDAIDSGVRHEGMQVYVKSEQKVYFLKGGITNNDWLEMGSGAGGGGGGSNKRLFLGETTYIHTFNGAVPIPRGWMIADGSIVNETNYDAIHGAGAWVEDQIAIQALNGKHTPNLIGRYLTGTANTTHSGDSTIPTVGANSVSLPNHTHQVPAHNHAWYRSRGRTGGDQTYNSSGTLSNIYGDTKNGSTDAYIAASGFGQKATATAPPNITGTVPATDQYLYTSNRAAHNTGNPSAATIATRPLSIEEIPIICVGVV